LYLDCCCCCCFFGGGCIGFGLVLLLFSKANKSLDFRISVFFYSICLDGFDSWVLSRLFVSFWHLGGDFFALLAFSPDFETFLLQLCMQAALILICDLSWILIFFFFFLFFFVFGMCFSAVLMTACLGLRGERKEQGFVFIHGCCFGAKSSSDWVLHMRA
jgi:hypothetical protein